MTRPAPATLSVAHWAANLSHRVASVEAWCEVVEKVVKTAKRRGCDMVIMPEYISEMWMHFAPPGLKVTQELAFQAGQAKKALPRLKDIVKKTGVALVAGSVPWPVPGRKGRFFNRCWMLFPDRAPVYHDKLVLIPSEKDPRGWHLETGNAFRVFRWRGFNLAALICLDIEMPAMSHKIAKKDIDLLLVPSFTEKQSGYYRVFNCARARAVELMAAVCVVGCIGGAVKNGKRRTNCWSGAAVYVPSEEAFGHTGVFDALPLHGRDAGIGKILFAKGIPVGRIRQIRRTKPEVWPGPWSADKVRIVKA